MQLDEFISETLKSVIKSVSDTTEYAEKQGAIINPIIMESETKDMLTIWRKDNRDGRRGLTKIDFDIAVTTSNEENNNVGAGLKVYVANIGGSINNKEINQSVSKINFSIYIALPHQGDK